MPDFSAIQGVLCREKRVPKRVPRYPSANLASTLPPRSSLFQYSDGF